MTGDFRRSAAIALEKPARRCGGRVRPPPEDFSNMGEE